jgi:hypothetical protein
MVVPICNTDIWKTKARRAISLKPAWATHRENLPKKKKKKLKLKGSEYLLELIIVIFIQCYISYGSALNSVILYILLYLTVSETFIHV